MRLTNNELLLANFHLHFDESSEVELSLIDVKKEVIFNVACGVEIELFINEFNEESNHLTFFLNEGSKLNIHLINSSQNNLINISGNIAEKAEFNGYYADISNGNSNLESNIILLGESSVGKFRFCSIANENNVKKYNISFSQIGEKSESLVEGYGVSLLNGEIDAKGVSHIEKASIKSIANQKIKVILFDKNSKAKASPTLKIDCDDIIANHACAIGSLNEDHIFYLKTRGLNEEEARRLITMGYLIPIENYFNDKGKEIIDKYIKEIF